MYNAFDDPIGCGDRPKLVMTRTDNFTVSPLLNESPEIPSAYTSVTVESAASALAEARRRAGAGTGEGTLIRVRIETDGRGRLGKPWQSGPGNLHCAVVLRPELDAMASAQLGLVALVSLGSALSSLLSPMVSLRYRWPNDLLLNTDKAAGVWLHGDFDAAGQAEWLAIGVSVNVASYPDDPNPGAVSIHEVEGNSEITAERVLEVYSRELLRWLDRWSDEGLPPVLKKWKQRADGIGQRVSIDLAQGSVHGELTEVDATGAAVVTLADGSRRSLGLSEFFLDGTPKT